MSKAGKLLQKFEANLSRRTFGRVANTLKGLGAKLDFGDYKGYVTIDDTNQILQFTKGGFHIRWDGQNGTIVGLLKFNSEVRRKIRPSAFKDDKTSYKYKGQSFITRIDNKKIKDITLSNISRIFDEQSTKDEVNSESVEISDSDTSNEEFDSGVDEGLKGSTPNIEEDKPSDNKKSLSKILERAKEEFESLEDKWYLSDTHLDGDLVFSFFRMTGRSWPMVHYNTRTGISYGRNDSGRNPSKQVVSTEKGLEGCWEVLKQMSKPIPRKRSLEAISYMFDARS